MDKKNFLIIFSLFLLIGCGNSEKEANVHLRKARDFRQKNEFVKACEEYRFIVYNYPESLLVPKAKKVLLVCEEELEVEKTFNLINLLIEEKHSKAALFLLRNLIDKHPDTYLSEQIRSKINTLSDSTAENLLLKAKTFQENNKYNEAIELYKNFIKNYPYHTELEQVKVYLKESEDAFVEWTKLRDVANQREKNHLEEERKTKELEFKKKEIELLETEKSKKENEKKRKVVDALKALKEKTR